MKSSSMKVKFFLLSLLGALALTVSAQETTTLETGTKPVYKTTFAHSTVADHWFITPQAGVGAQFLACNDKQAILDRMKDLSFSLAIGKYHTPSFATRLNFVGAQARTFYHDGNALQTYPSNFVGAHFDFMFDVVNFFSRYKANRVFHLLPFAGFGYDMKFNNKFEDLHHTAAINAGIQMQFRLGRRVDFIIEAKGIYNNLNIGEKWGNSRAYNGLYAALTGGFNFRLGGVEWSEVIPMDYTIINDLNDQISRLRAENIELSKRPVSCPKCPELVAAEPVSTSALSDKAIVFNFDSAKLDKRQEIVLHNISEFVKANNTPILVIGYADTTGDTEYNLRLSERRAQAVTDALVNDYGVSADLITTQWEGETDALFDQKAWNRVVIVRSK